MESPTAQQVNPAGAPQLAADPANIAYDVGLACVRHAFTTFAGYLVSQGILKQDNQETFIAALFFLAGLAWSALEKLYRSRAHDLTLLKLTADLQNAKALIAPAARSEIPHNTTGATAAPTPQEERAGSATPSSTAGGAGGFVQARALAAIALIAAFALLGLAYFTGCSNSNQPALPQGSYLDAGAGWSKDEGVTGTVNVHIPLDGGSGAVRRKAQPASDGKMIIPPSATRTLFRQDDVAIRPLIETPAPGVVVTHLTEN